MEIKTNELGQMLTWVPESLRKQLLEDFESAETFINGGLFSQAMPHVRSALDGVLRCFYWKTLFPDADPAVVQKRTFADIFYDRRIVRLLGNDDRIIESIENLKNSINSTVHRDISSTVHFSKTFAIQRVYSLYYVISVLSDWMTDSSTAEQFKNSFVDESLTFSEHLNHNGEMVIDVHLHSDAQKLQDTYYHFQGQIGKSILGKDLNSVKFSYTVREDYLDSHQKIVFVADYVDTENQIHIAKHTYEYSPSVYQNLMKSDSRSYTKNRKSRHIIPEHIIDAVVRENTLTPSNQNDDIVSASAAQFSRKSERELTFPNGSKYQGDIADGKPHGHGSWYSMTGELLYEGEWYYGRFHGYGTRYADQNKVYEGQFKNGKRNGQGISYYTNGDKYEGSWKNGFRHGLGTYHFANGAKHEGNWKNDFRHGKGKFITSKGTVGYEGDYFNDVRNGYGTCLFTDGVLYKGNFLNNECDGQGYAVWPNGQKYEGTWSKNHMSGFGVLTYPETVDTKSKYARRSTFGSGFADTDSAPADFSDEIMEEVHSYYRGELWNDLKHGKGFTLLSDGSTYEGEWRNDKRNGYGISTWPGGNRYEGSYKDSQRNGYGVFTYSDGSRYEGFWKDSEKHGYGKYYDIDGSYFQGEYKNGKRHGLGEFHAKDGSVWKRFWENGSPCELVTITEPNGKVLDLYDFDKTHKYGITRMPDGARYIGERRNGHTDGHGIYYFPNGSKYIGTYRNGKKDGYGVLRYANGDFYEGDWREGERDGYGILIRSDGTRLEGQWIHNTFQEGPK